MAKDSKSFLLYQAYKKLDDDMRKVIQIATLCVEPFSQSSLIKLFNGIDQTTRAGSLGPSVVKLAVSEGLRAGLLVQRGAAYQVQHDFSNYYFTHIVQHSREIQILAERVMRFYPLDYYGWGYDVNERVTRNLLIEIMSGKPFDSYSMLINRLASQSQTHQIAFVNRFLDASDLELFTQLPDSWRIYLLLGHIGAKCAQFEDHDELTRHAEQWIADNKTNTDDLVELLRVNLLGLHFLRGEWAQMRTMLTEKSALSDFSRLLFGLLLRCIKDADAEAMSSQYDELLKAYRKATQSRTATFFNLPQAFYVFTKLRTRDPAKLSVLQNYLLRPAQKGVYSPADAPFLAAVWTLQNEKGLARQALGARTEDRYTRFLTFFSAYWLDEKVVQINALRSTFLHTQKNGFEWVSFELAALLQKLEPEHYTNIYEQLRQKMGEQVYMPIVDYVQKIESWEAALNALQGVSLPTGAKSTAKENDSRVIWLVDFDSEALQPKEQTFGKSGWSSGRNVALARLKEGDVRNLTDQDRQVARHIKMYSGGWGSSGTTYDIDFDKALPMLVGHPLLYLSKSPTIGVQLIESKPILYAKENTNGYTLSFDVKITEEGLQVVKETPTRYKLLNITREHVAVARAMDGSELKIPKAGRERLLDTIAGLSRLVTVQTAIEGGSENIPAVDADGRIRVHLLPVGDGFHIEFYTQPFGTVPPYCKPGTGEAVVIGQVNGVKMQTKRNVKQEKKNADALIAQLPTLADLKPTGEYNWELEDAELCLQTLLHLEPLVQAGDAVIEWPKGEKFRLTKVVGFQNFSMNIRQKSDWFEVSGELRVSEDIVYTMQQLLDFAARKQQFIELSPGKFLALTNEFRKRLNDMSAYINQSKKGLQIHPLSSVAMGDFTDLIGNFETDKHWKAQLNRLKKANKQTYTLPENFTHILREYQREGFQWLSRMADWGVGACLADDMGLGKTIQTLALIQSRADDGATLVVAPASVVRNWVTETEKFAPSLQPLLFGEGDRETMVKEAGAKDMVIVTYDLLQRENELFTNKKFRTIVLDEAQAIKNRSTKRSETAMALQGDFKMLVTGTPLENHLGELWNLFQFINPGLLGSVQGFQDKFIMPIEKLRDDERREQLRKLVQPFILRRRKSEVLKELPEKTEIVLTVELSDEERAFYEALRRNALESLTASKEDDNGGMKQLKILAEIMRLRRACCNPKLVKPETRIESSKLKLFGEIVEELIENNHKALVFSQFTSHLSLLEDYLKSKGIRYQYLDGSTPLPKRQDRIKAFQAGEGDLFLISLKAGGTGLNLTAADYVIHMDPWWNPAVEDQASDRAHRIGQLRPVTVYRLVTENTIEDKILKLHEHKRDLADSLLSGTDVSAKLNADELLELISGR